MPQHLVLLKKLNHMKLIIEYKSNYLKFFFLSQIRYFLCVVFINSDEFLPFSTLEKNNNMLLQKIVCGNSDICVTVLVVKR